MRGSRRTHHTGRRSLRHATGEHHRATEQSLAAARSERDALKAALATERERHGYGEVKGRVTDTERLQQIREWFDRHRHDYSDRDGNPPKVWSEYFEWLILKANPLPADIDRLVQQAHDIEAILRESGIGPCPLPEGVRQLANRLLTALVRAEFTSHPQEAETPHMRTLLEAILADKSAYPWHTAIRNTLALQSPLPAPPVVK